MEGNRFDLMMKTLSAAGTRRGVLRRLTALPLVGALAALFAEEEGATKRRRKAKRRVGPENHKHSGRRRNHKNLHKKKKCKPKSRAKTCAGECGIVKNTCRMRVDCGSCACQPPCTGTDTCGGGGAPGVCGCTPHATCPPDLDCGTIDDGCGGTISCGGSCSDPTPICVDNVCTALAGIAITKSSDAGPAINVGEIITYAFLVQNTGQIVLEDVVVIDPLPGLSAILCPAVTSLAAGAAFACSATYVVTQADIDVGEIRNTATVTGVAPGNVVVTDDDSLVVPPN